MLGVGNRKGVHVMLAGCIISVLGMLYAFYGKPLIKRRRQQAVYAGLPPAQPPQRERRREEQPVLAPEHETVGATMRIQP